GFDLQSLLDNNSSAGTLADNAKSFANDLKQNLLQQTNLDLPILTDPLGDLKVLLAGENVVLAQWVLPSINNPSLVKLDLPPIPSFPPIDLRLGIHFGLEAGLTLGYDSYGLTPAFQQDATNLNKGDLGADLKEGLFLSNVQLALLGGIDITAEADVGIVK